MSEKTESVSKQLKVGYYSMGLSVILAGILLVLNQLDYIVADGIFILWPIMMILLGIETIITQFVSSLSKGKYVLKPAWGILFICISLVACSQVWLMLLDSAYVRW